MPTVFCDLCLYLHLYPHLSLADGPTPEQQVLKPTWSAKVQLKPAKGSSGTEEQPPGTSSGGGTGGGAAAGSSSGGQVLLTLQTDLPSGNGEHGALDVYLGVHDQRLHHKRRRLWQEHVALLVLGCM
jgi:hypothetical protein